MNAHYRFNQMLTMLLLVASSACVEQDEDTSELAPRSFDGGLEPALAYELERIQPQGVGMSQATCVSDDGRYIGIDADQGHAAYRYDQVAGQSSLLPCAPGNTDCWAVAARSNGSVYGGAQQPGPIAKPVVWSPQGHYHELELPLEHNGILRGANDDGLAVGDVQEFGMIPSQTVIWDRLNLATTLPTIEGCDMTYGMGVNGFGQVVGTSAGQCDSVAWYWDEQQSELQPLQSAGADSTTARAINDVGEIVGRKQTGLQSVAVFWPHPYLPPVEIGAMAVRDLNDDGTVVGMSGGRAAIWHIDFASGPWQLDDLVVDLGDCTVLEAHAIDDLGNIVGAASCGGGPLEAVRLAVVSAP